MRVAAIDCGTNSIRLLIADVEAQAPEQQPAGQHTGSPPQPTTEVVHTVFRQMTVVRLGEGVDETGTLSDQALQRCFAAVDDYAELLRDYEAERLRFVATSATRDVANRDTFISGIRDRLTPQFPDFTGPDIITGSEEAELSFAGAAGVLDWDPQKKFLVVDLGGGSTEFVMGSGDRAGHAISTDMGCVRFTERYMHHDPPTESERSTATSHTLSVLENVAQAMPLHQVEAVIGVAGTVTTVTAHGLGLEDYNADAIHGTELSLETIQQSVEELVESSRGERAAMGFMHPGRVDVIGAGALIWGTILEYITTMTKGTVVSAIASEHDILDGIALSLASGSQHPLEGDQ